MKQVINWINENKKEFVFKKKKKVTFECKYSKLGETSASRNNVDSMDWLVRALYFKKQIIKHKIPPEFPGFREYNTNNYLIKQIDRSFLKKCSSDKEVIF